MTELPAGAKKIGVKWVYKTKFNENIEVDIYKAHLFAKEFEIDDEEVYAPVSRMDTVRMFLALAAERVRNGSPT